MKTKPKKVSAAHKKLAEELVSLVPELDEAGLAFLVEQARVHLYNMEIERLEAERLELEAKQSEGGAKPKAGKKAAAPASGAKGHGPTGRANFRIDRSGSGSSYHLISGGNWKMYNEAEMMQIVKIATGPGSVREVAVRLHAWFTRERPDTFGDLDIGDAHDPRMDELVGFLRSKFTIKTK